MPDLDTLESRAASGFPVHGSLSYVFVRRIGLQTLLGRPRTYGRAHEVRVAEWLKPRASPRLCLGALGPLCPPSTSGRVQPGLNGLSKVPNPSWNSVPHVTEPCS